jgi:hypothetical protein
MHILTLAPFYPTAENDASGCFIAESVGELQRQGVESSAIAVHPMHHSRPAPDPQAPPATWRKYFCLPGNPGLSTAGQFLHVALKFHARQTSALRVLLSGRPLRQRLDRNGRQTVLQGYTLAQQARHLLTIYRERQV